MGSMSELPEVNVPLTPEQEQKVRAQDEYWTGPRYVALTAGFLGLCLVILYVLANLDASLDLPPY